MQEMIAKNEIPGAVTVVVAKDKVLHLECTGLADVASAKPMSPDTIFWIASMTKPITATAVLMLQDEGKLKVTDPVAKYIPEFADLKSPSGKPANLTITQILTHTPASARHRVPLRRRRRLLPTSCLSGLPHQCSTSPARSGATPKAGSTPLPASWR
jgi:hypothetical protein